MKNISKAYKLSVFAGFISSYMFSSFIILVFNFFSFDRARKHLIKNISFHTKIGLKLFKIKVKRCSSINPKENFLLVSNHLSYLDIFVISSEFPTCFVTSVEMKETPFLGQLCLLGGCLFVERRSRKGLSNEVKNLTKALDEQLNVVIFPEATSTNGEQLLKFRRPLFQAAIDAKKNILPVCLNYKKVDYEPITLRNRDSVFWYGDMTFFPHFLKLLEVEEIEVEITTMEKVELQPEFTKNELAEITFNKIAEVYHPINV